MSTSDPGRRHRPGVRVAVGAVAAAGTVLLNLGGCVEGDGSGGEPDTGSGKVAEVLEQGRGEFDLASPPSRQEAGLAEGASRVTYERPDRGAFEVVVRLPDEHRLDLDARLAIFDSVDAPDPKTGPPTTLDVHHYPATLEAGRDHLLAAAEEFGLDRRAVEQWYEEATGERPVEAPPTVRTPWLSTTVGYLRLQVQGRYVPPVDTPGSDQTVVHYALVWDAAAASPSP